MCSVCNVLSMECAMYRMCAVNIIRSTDSILFLLSIVEHCPSTPLGTKGVEKKNGTNFKKKMIPTKSQLRWYHFDTFRRNIFAPEGFGVQVIAEDLGFR